MCKKTAPVIKTFGHATKDNILIQIIECQYQRQLKNMEIWRKRNPDYFDYRQAKDSSGKQTCRERALDWRKRHTDYLQLYRQQHKDDTKLADHDRLREDLRLWYVALTRARHALWVGWSPVNRQGGKSCVNHQSAAGHLLGGGLEFEAADWLPKLQALEKDADEQRLSVQLVSASEEVPLTVWQRPAHTSELRDALSCTARIDKSWTIASFSRLTRDLSSQPVLQAAWHMATPRPADEHWQPDFMHHQALDVLPVLLAALGVDTAQRPVWLFGHSDGGTIALLHTATGGVRLLKAFWDAARILRRRGVYFSLLTLALAALTYFPLFRALTHYANPALEHAQQLPQLARYR